MDCLILKSGMVLALPFHGDATYAWILNPDETMFKVLKLTPDLAGAHPLAPVSEKP